MTQGTGVRAVRGARLQLGAAVKRDDLSMLLVPICTASSIRRHLYRAARLHGEVGVDQLDRERFRNDIYAGDAGVSQ